MNHTIRSTATAAYENSIPSYNRTADSTAKTIGAIFRRQPLSKNSSGAPTAQSLKLTVNGEQHQVKVEPWTTLLDFLRETLQLTGSKKGCDHGQCGACTVLVDGTRVNACLTLALRMQGREVTTIEGLASKDGNLHPLQQAFVDHDALQCGYCTPGQICSGIGLLSEGQATSREDIKELMSGNLCRCGAYSNITDAVEQVLSQGVTS